MTISPKAMLEIFELTTEAERLIRTGTQKDRAAASVLQTRAAAIREYGLSSTENRQIVANEMARQMGLPEVDFSAKAAEQRRAMHIFTEFLRGRGEKELRQLASGQTTISWTSGPAGGYLVPEDFANQVVFGLNLTSPLLSRDNVTFITDTNNMRPRVQPAVDLTEISGSLIDENTQSLPAAPPLITGKVLQGYSFRSNPIAASLEFEEDSFASTLDLLAFCFSVGLQRAIGPFLLTGSGTGQPTGLYTSLTAGPAVQTQSPTSILADELLALYHSVDRLHRQNPKCAWHMSERNWLLIRQTAASLGGSTQSAWRFMLDDASDDLLLNKKVMIDPSATSGPSSTIAFGDFSHFLVRLSDLRVRRNLESSYITSYQGLYTSLIRADCALVAPGQDQPIQYLLFHS